MEFDYMEDVRSTAIAYGQRENFAVVTERSTERR